MKLFLCVQFAILAQYVQASEVRMTQEVEDTCCSLLRPQDPAESVDCTPGVRICISCTPCIRIYIGISVAERGRRVQEQLRFPDAEGTLSQPSSQYLQLFMAAAWVSLVFVAYTARVKLVDYGRRCIQSIVAYDVRGKMADFARRGLRGIFPCANNGQRERGRNENKPPIPETQPYAASELIC